MYMVHVYLFLLIHFIIKSFHTFAVLFKQSNISYMQYMWWYISSKFLNCVWFHISYFPHFDLNCQQFSHLIHQRLYRETSIVTETLFFVDIQPWNTNLWPKTNLFSVLVQLVYIQQYSNSRVSLYKRKVCFQVNLGYNARQHPNSRPSTNKTLHLDSKNMRKPRITWCQSPIVQFIDQE